MTRSEGFTLIELVMVLVLVGIVAVVVAPMLFRGPGPARVGGVASLIAGDMGYARSLAMRRAGLETPATVNPEFRYRIRFNVADPDCPGPSQYTIVNDADGNGTWGENPNSSGVVESARRPADGSPYFCVDLDSGDFAGVTATADFGGGEPGTVEFDPLGVPFDSDGVRLAAEKTVTVTDGTETVSVTLTPNTGRVALQ